MLIKNISGKTMKVRVQGEEMNIAQSNTIQTTLDKANELVANYPWCFEIITDADAYVQDIVDGGGAGTSGLEQRVEALETEVDNKVDKVEGKGLSTNDFTDSDKTAVEDIANKVDKVNWKGLSTNDFSDAYKQALDLLSDNLDAKLNKDRGTWNAGKYLKVGADGEVTETSIEISDLDDVEITNPTDWQVLGFDGTSEKWKNKDIQNKKVILIQDSYGTNNGSWEVISTTTGAELTTLLWNFWIPLWYKARNGAWFCNGLYLSNLQGAAEDITDQEKPTITDIYVLGGWNDEIWRYEQTKAWLETAMGEFLTYAKTTFKNAKVHLAFISYGFRQSSLDPRGWRIWLSETLDIYRDSVKLWYYYEWRLEPVLHNFSMMVSDYAHPNAEGVKYVAHRLADLIITGDTHIHHRVVTEIHNHLNAFQSIDWVTTNLAATWAGLNLVEQVDDGIYQLDLISWNDWLLFKFDTTVSPRDTMQNIWTANLPVASCLPRCMRVASQKMMSIPVVAIVKYQDSGGNEKVIEGINAYLEIGPSVRNGTTNSRRYIKFPYICSDYTARVPLRWKVLQICIMSCKYTNPSMRFL